MKYINTSSIVTLVDLNPKLNIHIEKMNSQGWELLSVVQQAIGIQEALVLFWKKLAE